MTLDRRGLLIAGLLLTLGGCATSPRLILAAAPAGQADGLEALRAVSADREGLTLRVASTGCTRKDDFVFYVDRAGPTPKIAFARKRVDVCRAEQGDVTLRFSYRELGVAGQGRLAVLNPVTAR